MPNARPGAGDARSHPTLHDLFVARVHAHPDAEALRILPQRARGPIGGAKPPVDTPLSISWRTLATRAQAIAKGLQTLGAGGALPPSARVAILCDTRLEWVLVDVACVLAGLVSVPLFPNIEPETLRRVLSASDTQVVIAENPWQAKKVLDLRAPRGGSAAGGLEPAGEPRIVLIDEVMTLASGASATLAELGPMGAPPLTLAAIEARGGEASRWDDVPDRAEAPRADECWTLCYTPGTEGQPKGVMWTHDNLRALTSQLARVLPWPEKPARAPEVQLLATPLAQAFSRALLWFGLVGPHRPKPSEGPAEPPLVTALARSELTVFDDARLLRPTIMVGVPSLFERARAEVMRNLKGGGPISALVSRWADEARTEEPSLGERLRYGIAERVVKSGLSKRFGGSCRLYLSGGAPLGEGVQSFYLRHGVPLREAYGLVETLALTHLDVAAVPVVGCVGRALPGVDQRIGPDDELFLRGPQVSPGYWRDPAETTRVFDDDGWFATGDLARIDEQGRLFITGRKREIIVLSNGRTLAPRPIEAALREAPLVAQALVYGERRDFATALIALDGEELTRLAESEGLSHLDAEALSRHPIVHARISAHVQRVNQRLPPHAAVKKHALLASGLSAEAGTLTPTQTLRRSRIAERYRHLIDSFYAESF